MALPRGARYELNGVKVTPPDEVAWTPPTLGIALTGRQKRSVYWTCEWMKNVGRDCQLDWFDYDNETLTRFICTPPGEVNAHQSYTDAICQQVTGRNRRGNMAEIVATFLVNVNSGEFE